VQTITRPLRIRFRATRPPSWKIGSERGSDHVLVIVDVRGHAASDKPHEAAAYSSKVLTRDVFTVADAAGLEPSAIEADAVVATGAKRNLVDPRIRGDARQIAPACRHASAGCRR
jgi:hypothetical protein